MKYLMPYFHFCLLCSVILYSCGSGTTGDGASQLDKSGVFDAIVDVNGAGDHTSVQEAVNAMPDDRTTPWRILVKNGVYEEWVKVPESKRFLHLIGQDRDQTIISFRIHCGGDQDKDWEYSANNPEPKGGNTEGCVFVVNAPDFYAENITFLNSYGVDSQSGPQALAFRTNNDRAFIYNCSLLSFQDTWRTSTVRVTDRHYALNCWIEGAVDYIYGAGDVLVENSTLYNVRSGSVIVAPSHMPETRAGYIFRNCVVDGNGKAADGKQLLGRPWHNSPVAVYINTKMMIPVASQGWTNMGVIPALFAEYNSVDRNGDPVDLSERKSEYETSEKNGRKKGISRTTVSEEEAGKYTYTYVIGGEDNWDPRSYLQQSAPSDVKLKRNMLSWSAAEGAVGYIVISDGMVTGITTDTKFKGRISGNNVQVKAVNQYGSMSAAVVKLAH